MIRQLLATVRKDLRHGPILVASVGGLLVGAALGTPVSHDAYTYMWADDRFCNDCHVHDYANEAYEASLHYDVTTCHDCHLVPIRHYPRNLWKTLFDRPQGPEDIHPPAVDSVLCAACHVAAEADHPLTGPMPDDLRARIVKIDNSPLHQLHLTSTTRTPDPAHGGSPSDQGDGEIACMDCHGAENNRAHSFAAARDNCVRCHDDPVFTSDAARDDDAATEDDALVVVAEHGMGRLDCRECHFSGFVGAAGQGQPTP